MAVIQKIGLEVLDLLRSIANKSGQDLGALPDVEVDAGALKNMPFGMIRRKGTPEKFSYGRDDAGNIMQVDGPVYDVLSPGQEMTPEIFRSIQSQQKDLRELDVLKQDNLTVPMLREDIKSLQRYVDSKEGEPGFSEALSLVRQEISNLENVLKARTKPEVVK